MTTQSINRLTVRVATLLLVATVFTGCETGQGFVKDITNTANLLLGKDDKQSVNASFGELKTSQGEARQEVEDSYSALEKLAEAPAEEVDVYYAQYAEASRELRSEVNSYGVMIDEAEKESEAYLNQLSNTIGDKTNQLAQDQFDAMAEANREQFASIFSAARSLLDQITPLADEMDAQAIAIKNDIKDGTTGRAQADLSGIKTEVDEILVDFEAEAQAIDEAIDDTTKDKSQ